MNYTGNNIKSLMLSVEESLKRFRTHYIDLLYVHFWDNATDVEEIMDGLHNLVVAGKVLYLVRTLSARSLLSTTTHLASRACQTCPHGWSSKRTTTPASTARPPS